MSGWRTGEEGNLGLRALLVKRLVIMTPGSCGEELPDGSVREKTAVRPKKELPGADSEGSLQVNLRKYVLWLGRKV